ncbi:MAG: hydrogenase iron-sulfur subunit [Desulfobacter sp.]
MKETTPEILVLGGGVAGMSAALALTHQDVLVHLVEKQDRLGGNAATWACMATGTCQNCGACLSQEMAAQVMDAKNITPHLNTRITSLDRTAQGMAVALSSGQTLTPAKTIVTTGFTPFDPGNVPAYHTDTLDKVITTARLNTLIREETLAGVVEPAPRIAFLQCVGSRNRKENRDYCSQVCCKISMRHARKLLHLIPDADISLFYMDLQVIGKEARTTAAELSRDIHLIQGVPAELLGDGKTGRVTLVTEDPKTCSRASHDFDLVVLSVGMTPQEDSRATADLFNAVPNTWGFFNTPDADPGPDMILAGCAKTPMDILSARQDGQIAAATALRDLGIARTPDTGIAVLGDGPDAAAIAAEVAAQGYPACLFGTPGPGIDLPQGVEDLGAAKILAVDGTTGNFSIFHETDGTKAELSCGAIISAHPPRHCSRKSDFNGAMGLTEFAQTKPGDLPDESLILLDYFGPEFKAQARQALVAAIAAREAGKQVDVLMNKILVHGPTGQQIYDRARTAGIRFLRYDTLEDVKIRPTDKGFEVRMNEATLPGHELAFDADALVVTDTIAAAPEFSDLSGLLKLDLDVEGFLQPANVRHRLVQSQRKGIFFAGPGHDDIDDDDLTLEIQAILATLATHPPQGQTPAQGMVTVNEKKCAKCLTCYRVCPHGAIVLNEKSRPQIMPDACFECQACVSNCPAYAIESSGLANTDLADRTDKGRTLVLACERSAALAADNLPGTTDLVSIPCACRVSSDMILKALLKGADKVVITGCHEGNCRSRQGAAIAAQSVDTVSALPGMPPDKVVWQPVAANEPKVLARTLSTP